MHFILLIFLKRGIWVSYSCECQDIVFRKRTSCSLEVVAIVAEERAVPTANSRSLVLTNIVGQFKAVLHCDRQQNNNQYSGLRRAEVHAFLGVFAKFPKATISFFKSVRTCVRVEQLDSHWTDLHEILCWSIFRYYFDYVQFSLK